MSKPDWKLMVSSKGSDNKTYYKQIGVAWNEEMKDGREKVSLHLWMFPGTNYYLFPNDDEQRFAQSAPKVNNYVPKKEDDISF